MKLTKKFWAWVSQFFALSLLILRADLVLQLFKLIPGADLSQSYPIIIGFVLFAAIWFLWLINCAWDGFYVTKDFLFDVDHHRW